MTQNSGTKTQYTRRRFLAATGAVVPLAACGNQIGNSNDAKIDARVDSTLNALYNKYPGAYNLRDKSVGQLVMPVMTKAGFGIGGAYGRGALRVNDVSVDYYSAAQASFGLQIGAQQYSHVLFFMTDDALKKFRYSEGWSAGADLDYVFKNEGGNLAADFTTATSPVIAVIFGQAGLHLGATLEGTKYTRIIP
ncbi:MAG: YSC84-related protein [Halocynthiibacter sp.]